MTERILIRGVGDGGGVGEKAQGRELSAAVGGWAAAVVLPPSGLKFPPCVHRSLMLLWYAREVADLGRTL